MISWFLYLIDREISRKKGILSSYYVMIALRKRFLRKYLFVIWVFYEVFYCLEKLPSI